MSGKLSDWKRIIDENMLQPAPAVPSGDEEARAYSDRMDFVNWFERTTGLPFEDMGTFHHDAIARWIAEWTAYIRQQERERCAQRAENAKWPIEAGMMTWEERRMTDTQHETCDAIAAAIRSGE